MRFWMSVNGVSLLVSVMLTAIIALGFLVYGLRWFLGESDALGRMLMFGGALPFGLMLCAWFERRRGGGE